MTAGAYQNLLNFDTRQRGDSVGCVGCRACRVGWAARVCRVCRVCRVRWACRVCWVRRVCRGFGYVGRACEGAFRALLPRSLFPPPLGSALARFRILLLHCISLSPHCFRSFIFDFDFLLFVVSRVFGCSFYGQANLVFLGVLFKRKNESFSFSKYLRNRRVFFS